MSNELDIIIVNYNSTKHSINLIESTNLIKEIINKIILIDNNSQDFKKKFFKKEIEIIKNKNNLGFAKAVNQGIKKSKSKFILILNPDTVIINNSIKKLLSEIIKNNEIGAIGGKMEYFNGKKYLTANSKPSLFTGLFEFTNLKRIFPNNYFSKRFWPEITKKNNEPIEVTSLCGAFILFRRKNKKKLNLFDENYFLYLEDLDFCISLKRKGYKIILYPKSKIKHFGGGSNSSKYKTVLKHWYKSRKYFFKKHLNKREFLILKIIFHLEEKLLKIYHYIKNETAE